ncbi:MAG TPA: alkaline phosphatase family protein, partial [Kofleriaceae bacterium]|nr:alkaline phosphatase family protein [Kofleriaceae bacterium]
MRRAVLALIAACHPSAPVATTASGQTPRLVVLLVVDQWPEWAFEQKRPALHGGFDRLLREGAWHVGQHPSAATLTAAGHALFGTGEPPATSGILANEWWHRDLGKPLKAVEDVDGSVSARWLRVPGIADVLAAEHPRAKAVSVSLKDRAAILPLGHAGTPIWYDANKIAFVSMHPVPWLDDFNRAHPVSAHLHDVWTPLDAAKLAELSGVADDRPQEVGHGGIGNTFPHALADANKPAEAVLASPLGNDLVFDVATAAIEHDQLGADDVPDYLVVSLSAHDYVGHGWGQESWEAWDMMLRLDARLQQFLELLDRKVGAGRWVMIATSDHGASPDPKSKIRYGDIKKAANTAAETELGAGDWIADARYPSVYFTDAALKAAGRDREVMIRKVVLALRAIPGLGRVERMADVAGHCDTRTGDAFAICLAVDPERSGDIFYMPAEGTVMEDDDEPVTT